MWQLLINGPGYLDTIYDLPQGTTTLGRAEENDIVLSGDQVSRRHVKIHVVNGTIDVEDLGSRNGSKLNGQILRGRVSVQPGDTVNVGENKVCIRKSEREGARTEVVSKPGIRWLDEPFDVEGSVIAARSLQDSNVRTALDNVLPFEVTAAPIGPNASLSQEYLTLLYRVVGLLASADSLERFLDRMMTELTLASGASTAVLLVRDPTGVLIPSVMRHAAALAPGEVPVSDAILDAAVAQGEALAVANVQSDARFAQRSSVVMYAHDQVLCVPVGENASFGVVYLNISSHGLPIESLLDVVTAIANLAAAGMHRFRAAPRPGTVGEARSALLRHLPAHTVDRWLAELDREPAVGALAKLEERELSVLVVQLADLGRLTAQLTQEMVAALLTDFSSQVASAVFAAGGTLAQVGAGRAVAVFGAPYLSPEDARSATLAALSLRAAWEPARAAVPARARGELRMGLHTGKALAGLVTTPARAEYEVIGEAASQAAALCEGAAPGQLLVSQPHWDLVCAVFSGAEVGWTPLGTGVKQRVFEIAGER